MIYAYIAIMLIYFIYMGYVIYQELKRLRCIKKLYKEAMRKEY